MNDDQTIGHKMEIIDTREQLVEFARRWGLRHDWHEPDEQEIDALVMGTSFDNAGFWGDSRYSGKIVEEMHVIFYHVEEVYNLESKWTPIAAVNLATLCAWATNGSNN